MEDSPRLYQTVTLPNWNIPASIQAFLNEAQSQTATDMVFADPYMRNLILQERTEIMIKEAHKKKMKKVMEQLLSKELTPNPSRAHNFLLRNLPYKEEFSQFKPAKGIYHIICYYNYVSRDGTISDKHVKEYYNHHTHFGHDGLTILTTWPYYTYRYITDWYIE